MENATQKKIGSLIAEYRLHREDVASGPADDAIYARMAEIEAIIGKLLISAILCGELRIEQRI